MRLTMSPRIEKLETTGIGFVECARAGLAIKPAVRAKAETRRNLRPIIFKDLFIGCCDAKMNC